MDWLQSANIRDETQRPFVVGVNYVKGDFETAAQPEIALLSEGVRLDVQPYVIDADAMDLKCRLTVSFIDSVNEVKLPGKEIVVQAPRASQRTISTQCRMALGEALLVAPIVGNRKGGDGRFFVYAVTAKWTRIHLGAGAAAGH